MEKPIAEVPGRPLVIEDLDLSLKLKRPEYETELLNLQTDMVRLQRRIVDYQQRIVFVFEGMDAAGKGGAIKRLTQFLDPRGLDVHAIGAPNEQENRHHYLRRFWLRLPMCGRISIFDRSWYGRMMVEPIEGFCTPEEYHRAPHEIRSFEQILADDDYCILKFWLHIDAEEQLKRFKAREKDPLKKWKMTDEDWRNREKFDLYVKYANAMFAATNTPYAPWFLIPANNKPYARVAVLKHIVQVLNEWNVDNSHDCK